MCMVVDKESILM